MRPELLRLYKRGKPRDADNYDVVAEAEAILADAALINA